jgi:hypothetical protein
LGIDGKRHCRDEAFAQPVADLGDLEPSALHCQMSTAAWRSGLQVSVHALAASAT